MKEIGMNSRFENPNNEMLVQQAKSLAEQLAGNKLRPELVERIGQIIESKDHAAIDAVDPDSQENQKRLSPQARDNLRRAWDAAEGKGTPKP